VQKRSIGRRGFLKGAAAGAAALWTKVPQAAAQQAGTLPPNKGRIVVVGAGIAGLSAALTAREMGASVIVLERAPKEERGGNTRFSNGAIRAIAEPGMASRGNSILRISRKSRRVTRILHSRNWPSTRVGRL
jgi:NADPH-dependent 2,4-dienoyl-CoA reductase/sulfur reductase-like enzyme